MLAVELPSLNFVPPGPPVIKTARKVPATGWFLTHVLYGRGWVVHCDYTESGQPAVRIRFNGGIEKTIHICPQYFCEPIQAVLAEFERRRPKRHPEHQPQRTAGDVLLKKNNVPDLSDDYADLPDEYADNLPGWDTADQSVCFSKQPFDLGRTDFLRALQRFGYLSCPISPDPTCFGH